MGYFGAGSILLIYPPTSAYADYGEVLLTLAKAKLWSVKGKAWQFLDWLDPYIYSYENKCRFINARPEPLFKYRSRSLAFSSLSTLM